MKVIIAGSRTITELNHIARAMAESSFEPTEIVSGGQKSWNIVVGYHGADYLGELWAQQHNVPVKRFPADWRQGRKAGPLRNQVMVDYADAIVVVWDGQSRGTIDVMDRARKKKLPMFVLDLSEEDELYGKEG